MKTDLLVKSAKIIDPNSPHNGKVLDILIKRGKIDNIKKSIKPPAKAKVLKAKNLMVSPGWFDLHVNFGDPGFEHKEDLNSGTKAAAQGGFTGVAVMPSTNPPLHTKSDIEYIINKTAHNVVSVHPVGTLSKARQSEDLAEMYDMKQAGAVAFSDDKRSVESAGLQSLAVLYAKGFDALIMSFANDESVAAEGVMNEGKISTTLGMKGIPSLAEELRITRDIFLTEYNEAKLHFSTISAAGSVELIRAARKKGLNITADAALHNLILSDEVLEGFDSNYKVLPPLRTKNDIKALIKGLKDGTIDVICTDHTPQEEEAKKKEFDYAEFGIIGLETAAGLLGKHLAKALGWELIIEKIAINPRKVLQLEIPTIEKGATANLTFFDPNQEWTLEKSAIRSKSKNTPFIGQKLQGKALAVFNKGMYFEAK